MARRSQSRGEKSVFLRPRMFRGMPDSELEPAVVLILNFGPKAAWQARIVEVLPAEPVTPTILRPGLRSWSFFS